MMKAPRLFAAAFLLALASPAMAASGDASAGEKKSVPCRACHGEKGIGPSPEFPVLAGQHVDYLAVAMTHYKNGKRKNPIMQAQVANLSPKDIQDLAAFFAKQQGLPKQRY
jgi:cytochrome c553